MTTFYRPTVIDPSWGSFFRIYNVIVDSPEHTLAKESLYFSELVGNIAVYTDHGELDATVFYQQLISANSRRIKAWHNKNLVRNFD
jgi:hypothetical protein